MWASLNRINNRYSSIKTRITWITYYKLCEYLKILRRNRDFIHLDCEYIPPEEEITGESSRSIIEEKYTDNISTEEIVIKKELLQIVKNYIEEPYLMALADMKSKKECSAIVGYEYSFFCRKLNSKIARLRKHLKSLGFESGDFCIKDKKINHFFGWKYNMYNRY